MSVTRPTLIFLPPVVVEVVVLPPPPLLEPPPPQPAAMRATAASAASPHQVERHRPTRPPSAFESGRDANGRVILPPSLLGGGNDEGGTSGAGARLRAAGVGARRHADARSGGRRRAKLRCLEGAGGDSGLAGQREPGALLPGAGGRDLDGGRARARGPARRAAHRPFLGEPHRR